MTATHVKMLQTSSLSAPPSASLELCFFALQLVLLRLCIPPVLDDPLLCFGVLVASPLGWVVDVAAAV